MITATSRWYMCGTRMRGNVSELFSHFWWATKLYLYWEDAPTYQLTVCWDDTPMYQLTVCWDDAPMYQLTQLTVCSACIQKLSHNTSSRTNPESKISPHLQPCGVLIATSKYSLESQYCRLSLRHLITFSVFFQHFFFAKSAFFTNLTNCWDLVVRDNTKADCFGLYLEGQPILLGIQEISSQQQFIVSKSQLPTQVLVWFSKIRSIISTRKRLVSDRVVVPWRHLTSLATNQGGLRYTHNTFQKSTPTTLPI